MYGYTYDHPELWTAIWDSPKYYISTWGRIINTDTAHELAPSAFSPDYPLRINLNIMNSRTSTRLVHRIVAEAFMSNYRPHKQITFIDGDRWNPHILNLKPKSGIAGMFLGGHEWIPVRRLRLSDGREFQTVSDAAKVTGIYSSEIYDNLRGDRRHIRGTIFEWIWIEEVPGGSEFVSWTGGSSRRVREWQNSSR